MQTWEYSSEFALRSYVYLAPLHLLSQSYLHLFPFSPKTTLFYLLRATLAGFTGYAETEFAKSISDVEELSLTVLFSSVSSAGFFHASGALLPSATVMQCLMLSIAGYFRNHPLRAAFWAAWAILLTGWPFGAVLFLPVALGVLGMLLRRRHYRSVGTVAVMASCMVLLGACVDRVGYGAWRATTWNVFTYNASSGGDQLYGVEPFSYYTKNLLLNFNVLTLLFLLGVPLGILQGGKMRTLAFSALSWCLIVGSRPHKEERFLYPLYPLLCALAVLPLHLLPRFKRAALVLVLLPSALVSCARCAALVRHYAAPLHLHHHFYHATNTDAARLCTAGEWHRFPSSYFLPGRSRLLFLKSSFRGQLPAHSLDFSQPDAPFNDANREEPSRYAQPEECDFLVEFSENSEDRLGFREVEGWPFLDAAGSSVLGRSVYVPFLGLGRVKFGRYALFQREADL